MSERPNPDELLACVQAEEARRHRGKLKIFFGYVAGVGKTYAMLEAARREQVAGIDVVVGYAEPHGRPETEVLLEGLETLPPLQVPYRGVSLREFDLDEALARHPQLILVDELAHTNAGDLRHAKRWQDVEELLEAGIDVWTTCNVQHIESLNDVVAKVSGVIVRETVPDDLFSRADELALIDLPPEDLLERLKHGKVYVPPQAEQALKSFFKKENLVALRELALRRTAERVHVDVELARTGRGARAAWQTRECLLVCIGPSPTSAKVVRAAKRLAGSLQGELVAVHVEDAGAARMSPADRGRLLAHLRLAERLGAETVTLVGEDLVAETLDYACRRNVTKIVIGKSEPRRMFWQRPTLTDRLIRDSGDIDVVVVRGAAESLPAAPVTFPPRKTPLGAWLGTAGVLGVCTAMAWVWCWLGLTEANLVMTFLLGIVFISARYGLWPSVTASFLAVLLFDVFFAKPYYTIVVNDTQYLVTFAVMLFVGLTTVALTDRVQRQADLAHRNERRTEALHRLSRKLAGIMGRDFLVAESERVVSQVFGGEAVILLPKEGRLFPILDHHARFAAKSHEITVAQWVFDHDQVAGRGTDTLPSVEALYLPLSSPHGTVGVLGVCREDAEELLLPESRSLLEAYATLIALAVERDRLTLESQNAQVKAESEELRSALLASVSHDIRTPLAVIAGASSSLLEEGEKGIDARTRRELLTTVFEESDRLSRLVENLLRLTQLSAGRVHVEKDWHPVEDVIGSTLRRLERLLGNRQVAVELPEELLMGHFDVVLIQQVLVNLVENALRYTPETSPLLLRGTPSASGIVLELADRGPGLDPEEVELIFETFQRGRHIPADSRGAGLGLPICRAIAKAHGGSITAHNREGGGALFRLELPCAGSPPRVADGESGEQLS